MIRELHIECNKVIAYRVTWLSDTNNKNQFVREAKKNKWTIIDNI